MLEAVGLDEDAAAVNQKDIRIMLRPEVDEEAAAEDIGRQLVLAGLALRRFEPARASLEQRFLEITSRSQEAV